MHSKSELAPPPQTASSSSSSSEVTLEHLLVALRKAGVWIFVGIVIGAASGAAIAFSIRPVYRSTVVVAPVAAAEGGGALSRIAGQIGGLASLAGLDMAGGAKHDEAIAVLRSRSFGEAIIREEGLMQVFYASRWNSSTRTWTPDWRGDVPTIEDAWRRFDQQVRSVVEDRDRGLISVRMEFTDRKLAARLANLSIQRVNEMLRRDKMGELSKSLEYLKRELADAKQVGLEQAISRVMESQINERMLVNARTDFAFRVIDPAVPSDENRYVRPSKPLYAAFGAAIGAVLGFAFAAWRRSRR